MCRGVKESRDKVSLAEEAKEAEKKSTPNGSMQRGVKGQKRAKAEKHPWLDREFSERGRVEFAADRLKDKPDLKGS